MEMWVSKKDAHSLALMQCQLRLATFLLSDDGSLSSTYGALIRSAAPKTSDPRRRH